MEIACVQFECRKIGSEQEFFEHTEELLDLAKKADFVLLPELWSMELQSVAGDLMKTHVFTDKIFEFTQGIAEDRGQCIIGSCVKKEDRLYNVAFAATPDGVYEHKKTHLFGFEKMIFSAGSSIDVFEFGNVKFGIAICYEVEFPEFVRAMVLKGAEIVFCPSYTIGEHGYWRVRYCCSARAVENQVYVALSSLLSSPVKGLEGYGRSVIFSPCEPPWKTDGIIAEAGSGEDVIYGEVDIELLRMKREKGVATTLRDRRTDLYNLEFK